MPTTFTAWDDEDERKWQQEQDERRVAETLALPDWKLRQELLMFLNRPYERGDDYRIGIRREELERRLDEDHRL